MVLAEQLNAFC